MFFWGGHLFVLEVRAGRKPNVIFRAAEFGIPPLVAFPRVSWCLGHSCGEQRRTSRDYSHSFMADCVTPTHDKEEDGDTVLCYLKNRVL